MSNLFSYIAFSTILKSKHPHGKPIIEVLSELYDIIIPLFDGPVFKLDGTVWAIIMIAQETTKKILNSRRLKIINELNRQINDDKKGYQLPDYFPDTPKIIDLSKDADKSYDDKYITLKRHVATYSFVKCGESCWPLDLVMKEGKHVKVILKDGSQAVILLTKIFCGDQTLSAILICGINRLCTLDEMYMEFLQLVVSQMTTCLLQGKTREEDKKRAKILADLNHQKVTFFQRISHELKTPLTLMLSPLDGVINACPQDSPIMSYLQTIQRNTRRLLKLINTLLQFSNIEANQLEAHYRLYYNIDVPHDEELIQAMGDKVYLDHDMYETIVFNLCSNALKHTWSGCIAIRLYHDYKDYKTMVVLEVSDTGIGIPEITLPNIFQRFYRIESQSSRSHEGTGIGLALVKELITRHGGDITVTSVINKGTTFKCWFPIGCQHLPKDQIRINNVEKSSSHERKLYTNRQLYLEESSQWIKNNTSETEDDIVDQLSVDGWNVDVDSNDKMLTEEINFNSSTNDPDFDEKKYQVLLVDDNNDMRDHLTNLLKEFDIYRACDGKDALRVLKKLKKLPDLVLSDIMMPNMNGYELLDILRSNIKTQLIPVILLSAKASENSNVKGLDKGADDYLVKPFSARELIARIRANIELSVLRRKILFHRYKQEDTKQLLLSITNMIFSKLDLDKILQYIAREIYRRLLCERIFIISNEQFKNNKIIVPGGEDSESLTPVTNPFAEISDDNKSNSQTFIKLQEYLNNNSGVDISPDVYCVDVRENVSVLSVEVKLNSRNWGLIKAHRSPNSIWSDSEIELLQQMSNQISMVIAHVRLLEENMEKEIQVKAAEIANNVES
ncbi:hypothetical protein C2G38_2204448 [Gigaspora rosea]|uniref:Histidine kinase-like ATPase n=1 Tax=Gigaspora rosea TaxID=44941 RepID=A0A397ULB8_9GLOM|nr:hypothetical protein C2G38_2204448 [Gigaspora rosea]